MASVTTVGKILLKHNLPKDLHAFIDSHELESKNLGILFSNLADKHPDTYKDVVSKLTRLGFEVSTREGSTVRLGDLVSPIDKVQRFKDLDDKIDTARKDNKDPKKLSDEINDLYQTFAKDVDRDLVSVGVANNKTLAKVIRAGARGKPAQYRQTVFAPIIVSDAFGKPQIDHSIRNSYAEGLSLPEYLVSTFGARQGEVAKKLSVADAGYYSKQLSRALMSVKVEEHDCGTDNGVPVPTSDKDSVGSFLASPVRRYNKNNEITSLMLNDLMGHKVDSIVVRSPITCHSSRKFHTNAVCQLCIGKREHNALPIIGSYVGLTAASTMGEPLAQGQLNVKHTSGSATGPSMASGFKLIEHLANIPKVFPDKAAVTGVDGEVTGIRPAAQGGFYITIKSHSKSHEYYVSAGFGLNVKVGDHVEAGDILSEGIVNPAEIVKYKGIGEGRRYFSDTMKKAFDDSGMGGINRRNFEILSKAAIDHVRVTNNDGIGQHLPGSVVSYQTIEKDYQPRPGSKLTRIDQAYNKYLEQPILHYSIGDRITHRRIEHLKKQGVESVMVNDHTPDFEPEMQRLLDVPVHEHDWMHQLYSTNLERRLIQSVNTGATSDISGPSPIAGLAYALNFGLTPKTPVVKKSEELETEEEPSDTDKLSFE